MDAQVAGGLGEVAPVVAQDGGEDLSLEDVEELLLGRLEVLPGAPPGEEAAAGAVPFGAPHLSGEVVPRPARTAR